ncbi:condensation domain-containing protein, partial [Planctobacterium marinum]
MSIKTFIAACEAQNVKFSLHDDEQLKISAGKSISPELLAEIKQNKLMIMDFLKKKSITSQHRKNESGDIIPLSFQQQRLWLLDRIEGASVHYNMPVSMRLEGQLNVAALCDAFNTIRERHEVLRTHFKEGEMGEPYQVISLYKPAQFPVIDLSGETEESKAEKTRKAIDFEAIKPFDLSFDDMIRVSIIKESETKHLVLITMHHIASDGWSIGVLVKELTTLYMAYSSNESLTLPRLNIQYADYALWQRENFSDTSADSQIKYWQSQLDGIPDSHNLPTDYLRPSQQSHEGKVLFSSLDKTISEQLRELCLERDATLFMGVHAVYASLLARYSNEKDIVVGTPVANRPQKETEELIGFFTNNLVLRTRLQETQSFDELLKQNKQMFSEAYANQDVPFEHLVEHLKPARSQSFHPIFQLVIVMHNYGSTKLSLPGVSIKTVEQTDILVKYDILLNVYEKPDGIELGWEYNSDLFKAQTIETMARHFNALLTSMVRSP